MINRVTKKAILEGARLCQANGYWSDEVREYLDNFSNNARNKIDSILYGEYVSVNANITQYHELLLENGLLENKVNNCLISSPEQQKADEDFIKREYKKVEKLLSKCTLETIADSIMMQNK